MVGIAKQSETPDLVPAVGLVSGLRPAKHCQQKLKLCSFAKMLPLHSGVSLPDLVCASKIHFRYVRSRVREKHMFWSLCFSSKYDSYRQNCCFQSVWVAVPGRAACFLQVMSRDERTVRVHFTTLLGQAVNWHYRCSNNNYQPTG